MGNSDIAAWIGTTNTTSGKIDLITAELINSTIGKESDGQLKEHGVLPALWHWFAFPSPTHLSQLGEDGHPKHVGYIPPKNLTRRMWASGSLNFHSDLKIGEEIIKETTLVDIKEKKSQSGEMVFITYEHKLKTFNNLAITETQNIVYLEASDSFNPPKKRELPQPDYPKENISISNLMQYATSLKNSAPSKFSFRGVHPAFANNSMELVAKANENGLSLYTAADDHQCMEATALWEEVSE